MTHFFEPSRPSSGLPLADDACTTPIYDQDDSELHKLARETRRMQERVQSVMASLEECGESTSASRRAQGLAQLSDLVSQAARQMVVKLQIASKLTVEVHQLNQRINNGTDSYEAKRQLKQRVNWLSKRVENATKSGLKICDETKSNISFLNAPKIASSRESACSSKSDDARARTQLKSAKSVTFGEGGLDGISETASGSSSTSRRRSLDLVDRYWMEPHHRYTYHDNTGAMIKQDPLTLHNLGIAVQESYIHPEDIQEKGLPWNERDPNVLDIGDFEMKALNALEERVFKIYDKVADAALLACDTVDPPVNTPSRNSMVSINQELLEEAMEQVAPRSAELSVTERPKTPFNERLERLHHKLMRLGKSSVDATSCIDPLSLPPLPRPHLDTREPVWPREPGVWFRLADDQPLDQPNVANQHNLYRETKLRLFNPPRKPIATSTSRVLRHPTFDSDEMKRWSVLPQIKPFVSPDREEQYRMIVEMLGWLNCGNKTQEVYAIETLEALRVNAASIHENVRSKLNDPCTKFHAAKCLISYELWSKQLIQISEELLHQPLATNETKCAWLRLMLAAQRELNSHLRETKQFKSLTHTVGEIMEGSHVNTDISLAATLFYALAAATPQSNPAHWETLKSRLRYHMVTNLTSPLSASQALEARIRFVGIRDEETFEQVFKQVQESPNWKCRANGLAIIMCSDILQHFPDTERVYQLLKQTLWSDSNKRVRHLAAEVCTTLQFRARIAAETERDLESADEKARLHAVMCVATLGIKKNSIVKLLVEMLEIDHSEFVKVHVLRTLKELGLSNNRMLRTLATKEALGGPLGREAAKCRTALLKNTTAKLQ